ncbi:MAG: uracil-DNA glycosylase family protein, partial [Pseudomonadota bacterium]
MSTDLHDFVDEIRACQLCAVDMERAPRPVLQVSEHARILVAGQAPGNLAMESGRPFTDPSGDRLREWLQISEADFYDPAKVAIVPMGFCFPGYDKNGADIPPMKRCAQTWHGPLFERLPQIELKILIGGYAQKWHMGDQVEKTLTATVKKWR